ncbi:hypothetical protein CDL12_14981 [Handroanthus impetiginosus]|uniref:Uncharacterized protein n=1 Tax=Handroanthus impetiginosus TaxID=429701 RepID=A0A2G9H4H1_9LAMI|nr:hypothetical protein CDL12_14981 [Handroanthus impetiginosus]
MEMDWWDKMMIPMRKIWAKLSKRVVSRKTGLFILHQDVRTCEYEDVHILWDLLKRNETQLTRKRKEASLWKFHWTKCAPLLYRDV